MSALPLDRLFDTSLKRKRAIGLSILVVLLLLFVWFNRIPKLDTVEEDLLAATAPAAECFRRVLSRSLHRRRPWNVSPFPTVAFLSNLSETDHPGNDLCVSGRWLD